jgi:hypothetical protein
MIKKALFFRLIVCPLGGPTGMWVVHKGRVTYHQLSHYVDMI